MLTSRLWDTLASNSKTLNLRVFRVNMTPELAAHLLQDNIRNRKLKPARVVEYCNQMLKGEWMFNGEAIILSASGALLNGQHRLQAVVNSGVNVEMLIIAGIADACFPTMDTGSVRTGADVLDIGGFESESNRYVAAAIRVIDTLTKGQSSVDSVYSKKISNIEIQALAVKNADVAESIKRYTTPPKLLHPSLVHGLHCMFARKDRAAANAFFDDLLTGANLLTSDPVFVLRDRLLENQTSKHKMTRDYLMALVIKTWNMRRQGRSLLSGRHAGQILRWRAVGNNSEAFPTIE